MVYVRYLTYGVHFFDAVRLNLGCESGWSAGKHNIANSPRRPDVYVTIQRKVTELRLDGWIQS
jgi:hypothetical protein